MGLLSRFRNALNVFTAQPVPLETSYNMGSPSFGFRPDRSRFRWSNERSIITAIYTRMSIDIAGVGFKHIRLDEKKRYAGVVESRLNDCLTLEPNLDQGPRQFRQDVVMQLFDKGVCVIVPVDTTTNPEKPGEFEILSLRVGEVVTWYPQHVRVRVYNEAVGRQEEVVLPKQTVAIVENPLYPVMNGPNSTLQRLIRKLNTLDDVDASAGRLDLIMQLPYEVRSDSKRIKAEERREDFRTQLKDSEYGIAYAGANEKVIQLNRPVDNTLLKQVEYLTNQLYTQLGLTPQVMDGTADEAAMLNYINRTVEPVLDAILEAMERTFIGIKRYQRGERLRYFRNPFKLIPLSTLADIANSLSRNEILTANEIRTDIIGIAPSDDPKAEKLENSNMPRDGALSEPTGSEIDQT